MHQRAAGSDQSHRVFERNDIGCAGGGNFSQAVPNHRVRRDAPGFQKLRQSILDCKQRRLGVVGAIDQRIIAVAGKNHLEQALARDTARANAWQRSMAFRKTECVRYSSAAMPACCDPWPENMKAIGALLVRFRIDASSAHRSQPCREVLFQLCYRSGGRGEAKCKLASADVGGIAKVADRCIGIVVQPVQKLLDTRHQRVGAFGRKGNQAR